MFAEMDTPADAWFTGEMPHVSSLPSPIDKNVSSMVASSTTFSLPWRPGRTSFCVSVPASLEFES